ncbi:MAG: hypothetical protein FJX76_07090 [Armatimonadetes bacterium]|nr:hypothetical protein [Armatimonadota bacterium]
MPVVAATPRPVRVAQVPRPAPAAPYARPHPRYEGGIPTYTNADLPPPRPTATPSPTVEEWPSATPTPAAKKPPVARKSPTPKPKPSPSPKESPFVFTSPNPEESPNAETIPADGETPAETDEAKALADLAPLPNKDVVDRIQWSPTSLERRQLEFLAFVAELPPPQTVTDRVAIENFATLADEGGTFTEQLQIAVVDMPVLDAAEATGVANDMLTARALRTASAGIAVTAGLASVSTPRGRSFIKQGMTTRRIFAGFVSSTSGFRSVPPTPTAMLVLLADAGLQAARQGRALQRDRQMRLLRELQRSPEAVTLPRVGTDRLRAR